MFRKHTEETSPENAGKLRLILILAGGILGVVLLMLANGKLFAKEAEEPVDHTERSAQEELEDYQVYLEGRIRAICESVEGVSGVSVAVTLSGSFSEIYATETVDGNEEYVIVGSGSSASALHLSHEAPEITGIGVVCRGGGNADVRRELTALISAAFHVPSNRIYVAEAKS